MATDNTVARDLVMNASRILIIQADNPDADSLGSALALEQILSELDKQVYLYCGVDMPQYLHYLEGWSRVMNIIPSQFDASIIVDTSAMSLLERLSTSGHQGWIASRPCLILDHHNETDNDIPFATQIINQPELSSTGELIYTLAKAWKWPLDKTSGEYIASAVLGDTQGLTNDSTGAATYRVMADLTELGVNRPALEDARREFTKMDPRIFVYKSELMRRTEFAADGRLALVTIPQDEINEYSPLYNPAPLIQGDMLQTIGVQVAVVMKHYDDGKILGSIRCNTAAPIASDLAKHFDGGGHPHASGFKLTHGRPINEVKSECIRIATELLNALGTKETSDEDIQHAYSTD